MTRFTKTLAAATLTSAFALVAYIPASAADVYARGGGSLKDAPIIIPPTWTGFYIGGHLGGLFNDNNDKKFKYDDVYKNKYGSWDTDKNYYYGVHPYDFFHDKNDDSDFIGGIHLGWNWQKPGSAVVWGIEGDVSFADNIDYLASIRGRLGFASDTALIYLTAGVAFVGFDNDFRAHYNGDRYYGFLPDTGVWSDKHKGDSDETGWVIGGGAEFKLTPRVSFGVEGLYYSFDANGTKYDFYDRHWYETSPDVWNRHDYPIGRLHGDDDFNFWQIRARLTFHTSGGYGVLP